MSNDYYPYIGEGEYLMSDAESIIEGNTRIVRGYISHCLKEEKKAFVDTKGLFPKECLGKYVIIQQPRKNLDIVSKLFLVDRNKTKAFWWSPNVKYAMVFEKKEAAVFQAEKYVYNNVQIMKIKMKHINK